MTEDRDAVIADAMATLAEIHDVADSAVTEVVRWVERAIGETLLVRRPGVMDATMPDLIGMEAQAVHFTEAMRLVRQWIRPAEAVRLGDRLKVIPADVAEQITAHLRAAGLLT